MRDFIFQGDEHSCGYACIRMFIMLKKKDEGFRYLRIGDRPPYSLSSLQSVSKRCGVDLCWKKAENIESLKNNAVFPILLVLKEGEQTHMVLLKKSSKKKFLIYDPANGKEWIKKEEIVNKWTGIFGDGEVFDDKSCEDKKPDKPNIWFYITSLLSLTIGIASLGVGFFFLNQDGNFLIPVIMFTVYALMEILRRRLAVYFMKEFDKRCLPYLKKSDDAPIEEDFKVYQLYKKDVFSDFVIMSASLLIVVALGILVGINSPSFFISMAGLISYRIISTVFLERNIKKDERDLEEEEKNCIKDKDKAFEKIVSIQNKAYSISSQMDFDRIIETVITLLLSLIPFVAQETFSLNFYLLHFFSLSALNSSIHEVSDYHLRIRDRQKNKDYFLNFIKK